MSTEDDETGHKPTGDTSTEDKSAENTKIVEDTNDRDRSISLAAPELNGRETQRAVEVLQSGRLAAGETVSLFESAFADFCGTDEAVATSNGTTALHAALHALGIGEGDRVITTPFSFVASANAIRLCGATPLFADIDPETYNIDPHSIRSVLEEHDGDVDALLVVHLYGLPAPMDQLQNIAEEYDLHLIEDAAQAHGAHYNGQHVGTFGDVGCFSFYPTKNMTTGEGGAVVTDSSELAERIGRFINHGRDDTYQHRELGHNFRMTNLAAAIGLVQLDKLPRFNRARRTHASQLTDALESTPVMTPVDPTDRRHVYHQYTIRSQNRNELQDRLDSEGIDTGVYYPQPIHRQPAYDHVTVDAPVAERAAKEVLSLPVHPNCSQKDIETIARVIKRETNNV